MGYSPWCRKESDTSKLVMIHRNVDALKNCYIISSESLKSPLRHLQLLVHLHWRHAFLCFLIISLESIVPFFLSFIYLFLAMLDLRCWVWAFSSYGEQGLLLVAVEGLLIVVAPFVVENRL